MNTYMVLVPELLYIFLYPQVPQQYDIFLITYTLIGKHFQPCLILLRPPGADASEYQLFVASLKFPAGACTENSHIENKIRVFLSENVRKRFRSGVRIKVDSEKTERRDRLPGGES